MKPFILSSVIAIAFTSQIATTASAGDLKINIKQGMTYEAARKSLIKSGWQTTVMHQLPNGTAVCYDYDYNKESADKCFHEISSCSGTGANFCKAVFFDGDNNYLEVITSGEGDDTEIGYIKKWSKTKTMPEEVDAHQLQAEQ